MNSQLVEELWKRFQDKEAELDKVIQDYVNNGIIKVDTTYKELIRSQVLTIVNNIEGVRDDMIRSMNQWREFKRMEEFACHSTCTNCPFGIDCSDA